jgi:hypothetical protein
MKRIANDETLIKAKESQLIYLASPYTNSDKDIVEQNYKLVSEIAANLVSEGYVVFSPISYGHNLLEFKDMPSTWEFWFNFCVAFLLRCDKVYVCTMPGWENSVGVKEEIEIASKFGIPVEFLEIF